jgi:hypothetical protein
MHIYYINKKDRYKKLIKIMTTFYKKFDYHTF